MYHAATYNFNVFTLINLFLLEKMYFKILPVILKSEKYKQLVIAHQQPIVYTQL